MKLTNLITTSIIDKIGLTSIATTVGINSAQTSAAISSQSFELGDYALVISMIGGVLFAIDKIFSIRKQYREGKKDDK